ncbi:hypothetical protein HMPREF1022_00880 [Desulfovibrio sp. 6_1_46AFAA]|uniref:BRO-N domain-containing protein n=1 Tax=Desulfovibrio sp. 6_1_46AFAA TaxID=665942 RepID=UPI00022370ED|nr:Bro-N domain-containing protein [Desulfovibrio sp. 6_1_46AFAA]EGW52097.1 hypothetical protein HMPREF1022_00880 [Desulfovibrio sp. 6_1_46AFAA]
MAKNSISQVTPIINENGLNFLEYQGKILFSSEEIGRQLGYSKPSKSINILFSRNQKELSSYAVGIKLMSTDGKCYEVRHFTEEGVYIISMLANTPKAREFRAKLARLLREIREQRVLQAHEAGRRQALAELAPQQQALAQSMWSLGPAKKRRLRSVVRYRRMGLGKQAIAKLLDCDGRDVSRLLKAADALGWLAPASTVPAGPVQGNLLEVAHA